MQENASPKPAQVQLLCEGLLSLNLALVLFYYYLVHFFIEASYSKGTNDA